VEFQERFATEEDCREYLFASRWPEGFVCRACGGGEAGAIQRARLVWQCKDCGQQASVTAGTVMHATRTPLRTWFWAAYMVATHHPGISAKRLQRQLALSRYETAWLILHKPHRAMVAPERTLLRGEVEIDECFIGGLEPGLRGGRQHGKKLLVGVAMEVRGRARDADLTRPHGIARELHSGKLAAHDRKHSQDRPSRARAGSFSGAMRSVHFVE